MHDTDADSLVYRLLRTQVFVVPTRGLRQYLDEQTRAGCSVFIGLYMLALGLETAEEATSNNKKV